MEKILVVEDENKIRKIIKSYLQDEYEIFEADDYLTKSFSPRELLARTKAILRRSSNKDKANIIFLNDGEFKIYPKEMIVKKMTRTVS
ncbi:MAG: hypothetical protein ACOCXL_03085 [Halanaerobium sp.]